MTIPDLSLRGKVALVSGARRGICKTLALAFAQAGADVAVCDAVDDGDLTSTAEEIRKLGRRSLAVKTDISKKSEVDDFVKQAARELGSIDILLNGAAVTKWVTLIEMEERDWDNVLNVDLKGYFLCSQAAAKVMVKQKSGNIISIASTGAFKARRERGAYCIAKAGVAMMTKVFAVELAAHNIRVNAIGPGVTKTEFTRALWEDGTLLKQEEAKVPLGRLAETDDMVGAVLFLASNASAYVTGHTLLVDGGYLL